MPTGSQGARPFEGRTAVITGASGGIGAALALALAERGAAICGVGRRVEALRALEVRLGPGARPSLIHAADLTSEDEIGRLARRVTTEFGRLDMLVLSAGVIVPGACDTAASESFDLQYRTNLRAPWLLVKAFLPLLKESRGQVVFIGSTAALHARAGVGQYAATHHALRALADTLREEVNPAGVRVLTVYPGRTATELQERLFASEGRAYRPELLLQPGDIAAMVVAALALPRTAEVTDITMRPLAKSY
jgi:NADP-dependent 3-hydroxy acid dehydrogenase YdfG